MTTLISSPAPGTEIRTLMSLFVNNNFASLSLEDNAIIQPAPVIPIWKDAPGKSRQPEKTPEEKEEQEIPLFYSRPIFKAKTYDFL
jgi:hypothetical protein